MSDINEYKWDAIEEFERLANQINPVELDASFDLKQNDKVVIFRNGKPIMTYEVRSQKFTLLIVDWNIVSKLRGDVNDLEISKNVSDDLPF